MINRRKVGMVLAEFLGVALLTSVLLAVGKSGVGYSYFLASGVALATVGLALFFGNLSGAHFNPAVTLGMWSSRRIPTTKAVSFIAAQFAGGAGAWWLYTYLTKQALPATTQSFDWRILIAEGIAAMVIGMGYAAATYEEWDGFQYAAVVGGAVFVGMMVASLASNGIGNPALALGVHDWSWAYVAGPLIGGILGVNIFLYAFTPQAFFARAIAKPAAKVSAAKVVKPKSAAPRRKK
jgi:glycerol uptake facilitator-like aquaporin